MALAGVLNQKNDQINKLYGQNFSQKAGRVYQYMKDAPALSVFPSTFKIVTQHALEGCAYGTVCGAIGGAMGGGISAAPAAGMGALVGTVVGGSFGLWKAYDVQSTKYQGWLKDEKNTKINEDILKIFSGCPELQEILDPVHMQFMSTPVIDPTGQVFDLEQNRKWITEKGTSPLNAHQKLDIKDLKIDYETHGKISQTYARVLRKEVNNVRLNENEERCIQALIQDQEIKAERYFDLTTERLNQDLKDKKITRTQYAEGVTRMAKYLA